jgi:hypothetical protein
MNNRIAEIEKRLSEATPGPWHLNSRVEKDDSIEFCGSSIMSQWAGFSKMSHADEALFCNASSDLRFLLDEVKRLNKALSEFNNDDNWLIESEYIDRAVKTGRSDWVYVGKWDPRVFAAYAIAGDSLLNTPKNERRSLTPFYTPDQKLTNLCKERDAIKAQLESSLEGTAEYAKRLRDAEWRIKRLETALKKILKEGKQLSHEIAREALKDEGGEK